MAKSEFASTDSLRSLAGRFTLGRQRRVLNGCRSTDLRRLHRTAPDGQYIERQRELTVPTRTAPHGREGSKPPGDLKGR